MLEKPPLMPTGIRCGLIPDNQTPVGTLTFETAEGPFTFAINPQASRILKEALRMIDQGLAPE